MTSRPVLLAAACAALAGCAGAPIKQPSSTELGILAARVSLKGGEFPVWMRHYADQVYWAKVNPWGDLDLDHPIVTTVAENGDCLALDVPAGRYAPFAAAYTSLRLRFVARIDNDMRKEMAVDLPPGGVAYAGTLEMKTNFDGFLAMLEHAGLHGLGALPPFRLPSVDIDAHSPNFHRELTGEAELLRRARLALRGTVWVERVDERLAELGNPAPEVVEGVFRKRVVAPLTAQRFSYIDTLKWGAPERIPGGLQWRRPKSKARIFVSYVDEAAGGHPRQKALDELRLAGETSDEHVLYEVFIDSHPGRAARYTSFVYPPDKLVGVQPEVFSTQAMIVFDKTGYYVLLYRAPRAEFERFLPAFTAFVRHLSLRPPPKPETPS